MLAVHVHMDCDYSAGNVIERFHFIPYPSLISARTAQIVSQHSNFLISKRDPTNKATGLSYSYNKNQRDAQFLTFILINYSTRLGTAVIG